MFAEFHPENPARHRVPFILRAASPIDALVVARLHAERHGRVTEDVLPGIERQLDAIAAGDDRRCCAVAVSEGEVVGYAKTAWKDYGADVEAVGLPSAWYLTGVVVDPRCRRAGIGMALTHHRLQLLRERGAAQVYCFANAENRASIAMHDKLGFEEVTRDFAVPNVKFQGGVGVLFRLELL